MFLGRAFAAPRVKLIEDPYQRPELQFFPLRKGPQAAGEVIATFELIELDYSGHLEVRYPGLTSLGVPRSRTLEGNAGCKCLLG